MISSSSDYRRHRESLGYDETARNSRRRKIPPLSTAPTSTRVLLVVLALICAGIACQIWAAFMQ